MALGSAFISDAIAEVWLQAKTFIPGVQLGGIYANKPWYHNTRAANDANWPGNYSVSLPLDREGPATISAAIDLTMSTAEMIKRTGYLRRAALDASDDRTKYIREFLGTTNGTTTAASLRHDSEQGAFYSVFPDSSHLWHIHISFFRKYAADMTAAKAIISVLKGETYEQYLGEDVVTEAEMDAIASKVVFRAITPSLTVGSTLVAIYNKVNALPTAVAVAAAVIEALPPAAVVDIDEAAVAAAIVAALPPELDLTVEQVKEALKEALREGTV